MGCNTTMDAMTAMYNERLLGKKASYPRVIDLVGRIRRDGGIADSVRYAKGKHQYYNLVSYIERTYRVNHKMAMDAAKYFIR